MNHINKGSQPIKLRRVGVLTGTSKAIWVFGQYKHELFVQTLVTPTNSSNSANIKTNTVTDRQILWHHIRGYVDFFFQLNLLPPYSLHSQALVLTIYLPSIYHLFILEILASGWVFEEYWVVVKLFAQACNQWDASRFPMPGLEEDPSNPIFFI